MVSSNHPSSSLLSPLKTHSTAKHVLSLLQPSSHCCPRCSRHRCAKRARGSCHVQQRRRVLLQPEIHREISLCPSIFVSDLRIHSPTSLASLVVSSPPSLAPLYPSGLPATPSPSSVWAAVEHAACRPRAVLITES